MLIRYPGSKAKLLREVTRHFPTCTYGPLFAQDIQYVEPFFGAGAVGFDVMQRLSSGSSVWINDIDPWMHALWTVVRDYPKALMDRIQTFKPSVEKFFEFKQLDGDRSLPELEAGFRKLALHQMSFSGLGAMAGGPLGGTEQGGCYDVSCRWNAETLQKHVRTLHDQMRRFRSLRVTCLDFESVVRQAEATRSVIYLDPPYVEKGPVLYRHSMTEADHERLAALLRGCSQPWVLSYDDHPLIRRLYSWAQIREVHITYTGAVASGERPKNREVVIVPAEVAAHEARAVGS